MSRPWIATCLLLAAATAAAQDGLVTDRPDFTESAETVAPGSFQLEAGFTFDDTDDVETTELGEALLRVGLVPDLELRLGVGSYAWVGGGGPSGPTDGSLGVKLEINEGDGRGWWGRTSAALLVSSSVPTGDDGLSSDAWDPSAVLALSWELPGDLGLGVNLGAERPEDGDDRFTAWFATAALGFPIGDRLGGFAEILAENRDRPGGEDLVIGHVGLTYLVSPVLQLDARVARRLSSAGPDLQIGAGLGVAF